MSLNERKLADRLRKTPGAEPPPELLAKLKAEIPARLGRIQEGAESPRPVAMAPSRRWAWAASLTLVVGGGTLAYLVLQQAPGLETADAPVARSDEAIPGDPRAQESELQEAQRSISRLSSREEDLALTTPELDTPELADAATTYRVPLPEGEDEDRGRAATAPDPALATEPEPGSELGALGYVAGAELEVESPPVVREHPPMASELDLSKRDLEAVEPKRKTERARETLPSRARGLEPPPPASAAVAPGEGAASGLRRSQVAADHEADAADSRESYNAQISSEAIRDESAALERELRALEESVAEGPVQVTGQAKPLRTGSTGGSAEPNDQPYGDVFFQSYGTNPFVDTEDDPLSTFGLDVDTGSYTVVRRYLSDGHRPPSAAVRVEELVNAFRYADPPPTEGDFALRAEGAPSPWAPGERYHLLRLGVRGRDGARRERPATDLVFVVDTSGSMGQENRLGLVQQALGLLLDELDPRDRVALVTYGNRGAVRLAPTRDKEEVRRALLGLRPGGSTNAEEGLLLAYGLAAETARPGVPSRIILCSDGVANVGNTGPDSILERIGEASRRGVELTTVGFGMGTYNDVLMEQLADRGNGRYAYVDRLAEARRIFVEELTGTLQTLGGDAKAQLELDPRWVSRYRLIGYENRDIADHRFRDDTVDAGEIGVGHTVTALYEIKLTPEAVDRLGRRLELGELRLRYRPASGAPVRELTRTILGSDLAPTWQEATPALRLASIVARFGEILKGTYWAREGDLDELLRRAQQVSPDFAGDERVAELVYLIATAKGLE